MRFPVGLRHLGLPHLIAGLERGCPAVQRSLVDSELASDGRDRDGNKQPVSRTVNANPSVTLWLP